jgi:hypothetical protein
MPFGKRKPPVGSQAGQAGVINHEPQCLPCRDTGIFRTRGQAIVCPHSRELRKQAAAE